jgi:hypothetical protein
MLNNTDSCRSGHREDLEVQTETRFTNMNHTIETMISIAENMIFWADLPILNSMCPFIESVTDRYIVDRPTLRHRTAKSLAPTADGTRLAR